MRTKYQLCSRLWTDLNIDLGRENIRHCCKTPRTTPTSLSQVEQLGTRVFNFDSVNRKARASMVQQDTLPDVCGECKAHEPNSIRHAWNIWTDTDVDNLRSSLLEDNTITSYIEIDVGSRCDMACVYCGPSSSSAWASELGIKPVNLLQDNSWQRQVLSNLNKFILELPSTNCLTINILGGEPLLTPQTYTILEDLIPYVKHFDTPVEFMITTNLNAPAKLMDRFTDIMRKHSDIFNFTISVSIEDTGERAQQVRHGLNWERFTRNLEQVKEHAHRIYFTNTLNILSIAQFHETVDWMFSVMKDRELGVDWDITPNAVHGGYTDVGYIPAGLLDSAAVIHTLDRNIAATGVTSDSIKIKNIYTHINNIYGRLGSLEVDPGFFDFWDGMNYRKNTDYYSIYPMQIIQDTHRNVK